LDLKVDLEGGGETYKAFKNFLNKKDKKTGNYVNGIQKIIMNNLEYEFDNRNDINLTFKNESNELNELILSITDKSIKISVNNIDHLLAENAFFFKFNKTLKNKNKDTFTFELNEEGVMQLTRPGMFNNQGLNNLLKLFYKNYTIEFIINLLIFSNAYKYDVNDKKMKSLEKAYTEIFKHSILMKKTHDLDPRLAQLYSGLIIRSSLFHKKRYSTFSEENILNSKINKLKREIWQLLLHGMKAYSNSL
jgi:hypothetical protein